MLSRRSSAVASGRQTSLPRAIGWAVLIGLLLPIDVRGEDETDEELPAPEEITLKCKDGLLLHAEYYPSIHEKNSVPIVLLHDLNGNRHDFDELALLLQEQGHAVVTPDLRGHGASVEIRSQDTKRVEKLTASALRTDDFRAMIHFDVEAVKAFLIDKNNAGELNIEKLCVGGAGMGAMIAAHWAQLDWSWPMLATGKQGQDVKALILISPESNFKGLRLSDAINDPAVKSSLAIMLIAGKKDAQFAQEVNRLYSSFQKTHDTKGTDLVKFLPVTKLQGVKLLSEKSKEVKNLGVNAAIGKFAAQLVKRQEPWTQRKNPLE